MDIDFAVLINILTEAYDANNQVLVPDRDAFITTLLDRFKIKKEDKKFESSFADRLGIWKSWTVAELNKVPIGSVFSHETQGKFKIVHTGFFRFVSFENKDIKPSEAAIIVDNEYPYDRPLRLESLGEETPYEYL